MQNGRPLPNAILKYIYLNENEYVWITIKISLKFVCSLKPLFKPMMVNL